MSNKGQILQDPFLNALRKEHIPVSIYLVNGIKLQGQIESFDQYVVLLRNTVTQWCISTRSLPSFLHALLLWLRMSRLNKSSPSSLYSERPVSRCPRAGLCFWSKR